MRINKPPRPLGTCANTGAPARIRARGPLFPLPLCLLLAAACQPSSPATSPPASGPPASGAEPAAPACRVVHQGALPPWTPAPERKPQNSTLWLNVDASTPWLEQQIERRLPRQLASGRDHPIGAPGRLTYEVSRGNVRIGSHKDAVVVHVPVNIEMSVCKPLGGICLTYGRCQPSYDVSASMEGRLTPDGELPPVRLGQRVTAGCRIGLDVTNTVTSVVQQQLDSLERRVRGELPELTPWVDDGLSELRRPVELSPAYCLTAVPQGIMASEAHLSGGRVALSVGTTVSLDPIACDANVPTPQRPAFKSQSRPGTSRVLLPELVGTAELSAGITRKLQEARTEDLQLTLTELSTASEGLVLSLDVQGNHCGQLTLAVTPQVKAGQLVLTVGDLASTDLDPALQKSITGQVAGVVSVPLASADLLAGAELLVQTLSPLLDSATEATWEIELPRAQAARARVVEDGVLVTQVLKGPVSARMVSDSNTTGPRER